MGGGSAAVAKWRCLAVPLALAAAAPARAGDTAAGQPWVTVYADADLVGVDGERSWLKGDDGKLRYGGSESGGTSGFGVKPFLTEAGIALQPKLGWSLGATVVGVYQRDQDKPFDLSEAFLTWKPMPIGGVRISARAGLFWPPVSLEHGGVEWAVRETVTPSALDSWIGEEVKVAGTEATVTVPVANHRITATGALFGDNDTSGTLLAFRGWALDDIKATLRAEYPLPPRNPVWSQFQYGETTPLYEIDDRVGWYAKLTWRPPVPVEVQGFYYDNRGNSAKRDDDFQWGWRTRFGTLGVIGDIGSRTRLIAQGMIGRTEMGPRGIGGDPGTALSTDFRTAYLLATRETVWGSFSGRVEAFGTHTGGSVTDNRDGEHGWAVTAAARKPIDRHATLLVEALHVDSSRGARLRLALDPEQSQTMVRVSLRLRASH